MFFSKFIKRQFLKIFIRYRISCTAIHKLSRPRHHIYRIANLIHFPISSFQMTITFSSIHQSINHTINYELVLLSVQVHVKIGKILQMKNTGCFWSFRKSEREKKTGWKHPETVQWRNM